VIDMRGGNTLSGNKGQQNPQERMEREKIAKYKHGVLALYPEKGLTEGGNLVTFIHSPENASVQFSTENYGGCKFGTSEIVPVSGVTKCIYLPFSCHSIFLLVFSYFAVNF
jgi:hypothetical protein